MSLIDFTKEDLNELIKLLKKLDKNRHFFGDGVKIGMIALTALNGLFDYGVPTITKAIEKEDYLEEINKKLKIWEDILQGER